MVVTLNPASREEGGKGKETQTIFDTLPRVQVSAPDTHTALDLRKNPLLLSEDDAHETVKPRSWPCLPGELPQDLSRCFVFARKRGLPIRFLLSRG